MKAIDLGLSVNWADRNLGASSPEDKGELYAWAETSPKDKYTWENYNDWVSSGKYGPYKETHFRREIHSIKPSDDAVTQKCGAAWRIPTENEFEELIANCKWIQTKECGVPGYKICGTNGNSIFLPIFGNPSEFLNYWSATRMPSPQHASILEVNREKPRMFYRSRFYGFCLRGVCDNDSTSIPNKNITNTILSDSIKPHKSNNYYEQDLRQLIDNTLETEKRNKEKKEWEKKQAIKKAEKEREQKKFEENARIRAYTIKEDIEKECSKTIMISSFIPLMILLGILGFTVPSAPFMLIVILICGIMGGIWINIKVRSEIEKKKQKWRKNHPGDIAGRYL